MNPQVITSPLPKRTPFEIQRAVLFALFQRELKSRLGGRWLGFMWIMFEPITHIVFMMLVYQFIRNRVVPGMPTPLFLLTGIIPFIIFRNVSVRAMGAIDANRGLFGYRQVKPMDTLLARALLETILSSMVYVFMLGGLGWFGFQWFPAKPIELMLTSVILIVLGIGLGLVLVVITDDVPKLRVIVRIAFMPLYLMSGVIFPVRNLSDDTIAWLAWNPLLHLMESSRGYFAPQYPVIRQVSLQYPAFVALVILSLGLAMYSIRRYRLQAR